MLMTIEKPKDKGKAKVKGKVDASTIMFDLVDRPDEVVVGMADRVVKARVVYRVLKEQRDGARDTRSVRGVPWQQVSTEIGGGELRARVSDLWSGTLRWDVQLAGSQPGDRRKIFTHTRAVKDVTLQDATVNAACGASVQVTGKVMEPREDKARWFCIRRDVELAKCGFSKDCEGCRVEASGDEVSRRHGEECRQRIRVAMMCDDEASKDCVRRRNDSRQQHRPQVLRQLRRARHRLQGSRWPRRVVAKR